MSSYAEAQWQRNRTVELYLKIRDQFEAIELPKLVVDTGRAMSLDSVREYL